MTLLRRAIAGAAALGASLILVGCTPQATPIPTVVVEHAGSSALENDESVVALRASQLAEAMAWNTGDFTIAPLTESTTPEGIDSVYDRLFSYTFRDYDPQVYVGPEIWSPISVTPTDDGFDIVVCLADQDRILTKEDPDASYDLSAGQVVTWVVNVGDHDRVEVDHVDGTEDECDASAAEVVSFDPVPAVPDEITEGGLRKPAGQ